MRRVLRLPADAPPGSAEAARKAFQTSLLVASVRCLLMYIVFPFVLPAVGLASGVGPAIGLVINSAAMVCIVLSMRRFWRADHPKRWWYFALGWHGLRVPRRAGDQGRDHPCHLTCPVLQPDSDDAWLR